MKRTPCYVDVYESDSSESLSETRQVVSYKKSIECDPKEMKNKQKEVVDMVQVMKKPKEVVDMVQVIRKPMSKAQSQALLKAQLKRSEKFKLIREKDEKDK